MSCSFCSLLVRQHGSHACWSHAEAFLSDPFWCRFLAMLESCVASLWWHCTWSHSRPITSTCTCALCGLTLRRCFPTLAGVIVLLAVVWRTRATGRLSEVIGFVVYNCWPCPLSSWFLRNFWFPELIEVAASLFLARFSFFGW